MCRPGASGPRSPVAETSGGESELSTDPQKISDHFFEIILNQNDS
jgi:hypothetical protein